MHWIGRHPVIASVITALLCALLGLGLPRLEVDVSSEGVFIEDDPDLLFYQDVCETFGDDVFATIMLQADNIFEPDILREVRNLGEAAEGIDGVTRLVSLFTVNNLKGRDGILDTEKLIPEIPTSREDLNRIRSDALENEILVGEVVADDGRATAIHLFIESRPYEVDYEARLTRTIDELVVAANQHLGPSVEIYHTGAPQVKVAILEKIHQDRRNLLPIQATLLFLALFLFARCGSAVALPLLTGGLSIVATLGLMGWIGFAITPVSVIIPSLILVIGATEDVHLVFAYKSALNKGHSRQEAVDEMIRSCAKPITLTSLTTLIGFATLSISPIPLIKEFGIAAAAGIAINFLITILMVPTCIRFFGSRKAKNPTSSGQIWGILTRYSMIVATSRRGYLALGVFVFIVTCSIGITRIEVDTSYIRFFKPDDPLRVNYQKMYDSLVGGANLLVIVDGAQEDDFLKPENLIYLEQLNEFLSKQHGKVLGYTNYIRRMHRALNDEAPSFYSIPESSEHISQYNLLLPSDATSRFINFDYSRAKILIRSYLPGSKDILQEIAKIKTWEQENFPEHLKVRVTGDNVLLAKSSQRMSTDILVNLGWMLGVIIIIVGLVFRSLGAGLISLVPNILPILSVFGLMGLLGIPLSTGTFPVAIIALGIAIDDTIHLMTRFSMETGKERDSRLAMRRTISKEVGPVTTTSVALALGFLPLVLANFATTAQFGLLTAATMLVAWCADLLVTPTLLLARTESIRSDQSNAFN